jgi:hypothetical protein
MIPSAIRISRSSASTRVIHFRTAIFRLDHRVIAMHLLSVAPFDTEITVPLVVEGIARKRDGYTVYSAWGTDIAVSYDDDCDEPLSIYLKVEDRPDPSAVLVIPQSTRAWDANPDELWIAINLFANMNAKRPIIANFYDSLSGFFEFADFFAGAPLPMLIDNIIKSRRLDEKLPPMGRDEAIGRIMIEITRLKGNLRTAFARYVVLGDGCPFTTHDIDAAVAEKLRSTGGVLIDLYEG